MNALEGLKILDHSRLLPGAYCSLLLAGQGAEVIKIEQPGAGDYNRGFAPINVKESGFFLLLNRNKKSITLDLKNNEGCAVFLKLVDRADVILEGVSGHDMNYPAEMGALQLFARKGQQPIVPWLSIADVVSGLLMAVFGIQTAVLARQNTGRGQMVDVSMFDGALTWLTYHGADFLFGGIKPKGGERPFLSGAPCYYIYRCADGKYVTLGIIEPHFWERFCDFIERQDLKDCQWPDTRGQMKTPPPLLGQHTSEILQGMGYSAAEIETLAQDAVT